MLDLCFISDGVFSVVSTQYQLLIIIIDIYPQHTVHRSPERFKEGRVLELFLFYKSHIEVSHISIMLHTPPAPYVPV